MGCPALPALFLVRARRSRQSSAVCGRCRPSGTLSGAIEGIQSVDEWQLDVVEPSRGLVISSSNTLKPTSGGAAPW